jgi:hypothetical protein
MAKTDKVARIIWIQVSENGQRTWVNTSKLRSIQDMKSHCVLVFNTKHKIETDNTLEEVLLAMGYPQPARPPLESHEIEAMQEVDA